jgi:glutamate dehydrogenase
LIESGRGFEEAYSLAAAQQLKNKDIAEGGAKATIVLKPGVNPDRAGRDFIEGLLDLIIGTAEEDTELLYLGPDENVSPKLIDWIVQRSAQRGYPFPNAIMSSKPRSGVNHKEFGVTSEGVTAFLKHALQYASIDPETDSFSVKLTGGPDGDVAGNEIKILIREFGPRVKFVGFADGSGSAVDPDGLDHRELLRLVDQQRPLAAFDTSLLSSRGYASGLSTREDVERRDDLQFNVKSDVFIPAGGRPFTINRSNWTAYFDEHGTPAARIVIEGANLFVQDAARKELSDRGVIIVQDSSANKCGVICSSLEIVSGMLLSERQFLKIKPVFVEEVLELLRGLADIEATCLFNDKERLPDVSLPELSVLISRQILRLGDIIHERIADWTAEDNALANQLVLRFLPPSLVATAGEGLVYRIPLSYRNQLIAAILSSQITYREGHQHLHQMSDADLGKLAQQYLRLDPKTEELIRQVAASGISEANRIAKILRYAGSRAQRELGI